MLNNNGYNEQPCVTSMQFHKLLNGHLHLKCNLINPSIDCILASYSTSHLQCYITPSPWCGMLCHYHRPFHSLQNRHRLYKLHFKLLVVMHPCLIAGNPFAVFAFNWTQLFSDIYKLLALLLPVILHLVLRCVAPNH